MISVVINTLNEQDNLPRALKSIKNFADEIILVDMHSTDDTVKIAKKAGARTFTHKKTGYVEPARNFAITKASHDWILILDADEQLPKTLAQKLKQLAKDNQTDFVRIPRKNIIFGKWIKNSRWWPDYNIRFFQKGSVTWQDAIHSIPLTRGHGADLPTEEQFALTHHHYQTISQYLARHNNYTDQYLQILKSQDYKFKWLDLIHKPTNEFLSRYFQGHGYQDGLHGLVLSLLQAFTEFIIYLKAWESQDFPQKNVQLQDFQAATLKPGKDLRWWLLTEKINHTSLLKTIPLRLKRKLLRLLP
jgi:glycosyltransferase involved in cell wall biosynthesis